MRRVMLQILNVTYQIIAASNSNTFLKKPSRPKLLALSPDPIIDAA